MYCVTLIAGTRRVAVMKISDFNGRDGCGDNFGNLEGIFLGSESAPSLNFPAGGFSVHASLSLFKVAAVGVLPAFSQLS